MKTVTETISSKFRDKGSKFMGYLFSSASVKEFDEELNNLKLISSDASHHCYAWRLNPNKIEEFAQDDGEPSGTAGLPILNKLKSFDAVNCGCVVVRYYGGTNLGKSGLIKAYGHTAQLCLDSANMGTLVPTQNFRIQYSYDQQAVIDRLKNQFDLKEIKAEYLEKITLTIRVPPGTG
ncbi:MAG: YigZ family protein [Fodinibius sp.]|nr:YigZ family protein [Fodinibius sp.]